MQTLESLDEFFWAHVDRACRKEGVSVDPRTEHYLVRLLAGYAAHSFDDAAPLALRYQEALEAVGPERRAQLREIGDTSLYLSGFWFESFAHRAVDVDYYIGMGESAYGALSRSGGVASGPGEQVFEELAGKFSRFVRVLSLISEMVMPESSPRDVVKLYEHWRKTGSRFAERRLASLGVTVGPGAAGKPQ
jgi:hypothetical protein